MKIRKLLSFFSSSKKTEEQIVSVKPTRIWHNNDNIVCEDIFLENISKMEEIGKLRFIIALKNGYYSARTGENIPSLSTRNMCTLDGYMRNLRRIIRYDYDIDELELAPKDNLLNSYIQKYYNEEYENDQYDSDDFSNDVLDYVKDYSRDLLKTILDKKTISYKKLLLLEDSFNEGYTVVAKTVIKNVNKINEMVPTI